MDFFGYLTVDYLTTSFSSTSLSSSFSAYIAALFGSRIIIIAIAAITKPYPAAICIVYLHPTAPIIFAVKAATVSHN